MVACAAADCCVLAPVTQAEWAWGVWFAHRLFGILALYLMVAWSVLLLELTTLERAFCAWSTARVTPRSKLSAVLSAIYNYTHATSDMRHRWAMGPMDGTRRTLRPASRVSDRWAMGRSTPRGFTLCIAL